ncbi:MAG: hypothetical protein AAB664_00535 [Patescibacteria group bacterium]
MEVVPLITLDVNYVGQTPSGHFSALSTLPCLLFRPKNEDPKKKQIYKALPLGLAGKSVLDTWNFVASNMSGKEWPIIEEIPNRLRKVGSRKLTFAPQFLKEKTYRNVRKQFDKGSKKWKDVQVEDKVSFIGYLFGQMLKLAPRSQKPIIPVLDENGAPMVTDGRQHMKVDTRKQIWRVKLGEGSLELTLCGVEGEVNFDDRIPIVEVRSEIDSFKVLNTTPLIVDIDTIGQSTHAWLARPYDDHNPLYVSGLELGLVTEQDSRDTARAILEDLGRNAIEKLRDEMLAIYEETTSRLMTATEKPTIEEVLNGRLLRVMLHRMNKDDAAAKWIESKIEGNFDPNSPFHMQVRRYVIQMIARAADYRDPEQKKAEPAPAPVEEKKVEEEK